MHVECEEESEATSHPTIVANSMTFVFLLLVISYTDMYTNDNIKIITKSMIIVLFVHDVNIDYNLNCTQGNTGNDRRSSIKRIKLRIFFENFGIE